MDPRQLPTFSISILQLAVCNISDLHTKAYEAPLYLLKEHLKASLKQPHTDGPPLEQVFQAFNSHLQGVCEG